MPGPPADAKGRRESRLSTRQHDSTAGLRWKRGKRPELRRHPANSTPSSPAHLAHILGPSVEDRQNSFSPFRIEADDAPADAELLISRQRRDLIGREGVELFWIEADGDRTR